MWAASCGHLEVVKALLQAPGVDVDVNLQNGVRFYASN